jgi:hypothetical protein
MPQISSLKQKQINIEHICYTPENSQRIKLKLNQIQKSYTQKFEVINYSQHTVRTRNPKQQQFNCSTHAMFASIKKAET